MDNESRPARRSWRQRYTALIDALTGPRTGPRPGAGSADRLTATPDLLYTALASIGDGVIVTDAGNRVTFMNAEAERLSGWLNADARGRALTEVFRILDERTREPLEDPWDRMRRVGSSSGLLNHTILISRNGQETPIGDNAAPIRGADGALAGMALVFRDVTGPRAVQAVQSRLAAIVQSSGDAIISKTLDGIILTWNEGAERIFGYSSDEVVGRSITLSIPHDRLQEEERILDHIRSGRPVNRFETIRVTKDGRLIPVSVTVSPVKNAEGGVIGASTIVSDNSEVVAARDALMREKELLATTLASIGDAVIVTDAAGAVTFLNGEAERLTGWTSEGARGLSLPKVFHIINEQTRAVAPDPVQLVLQSGLVMGLANHTLLVARDGRETPIDDSAAPIGGRNGSQGVVLVFRDVTERRQAEEIQRQADRRKDQFLAILSHELRNPLAPITMAIAMLRKGGPQAPELQQLHDIIERQTTQMARLLDDLLDVSRIGAGKVSLHPNRISVAVALSSAIESVRPLIDARQHRLVVVVPQEPIEIKGDLGRLSQVFANLLSNAAKYTERGGRITVTLERQNREAVVRVADTGIGIAPNQLGQVFELFAQVDQSLERGQGGLGVGLSLARTLVELHGGHLEAHSEGLGRGSEFVVRLPALTGVASQQAASPEAADANVRGLRILVADDNADSAFVLAQALRDARYEVAVVHDGEAAVNAAGSFHPNVAILDIGMPKLNGYEAARRIRAQAAANGERVQLIAVTGWGQEHDRREAKEAGFDQHLTKPVDFRAIQRVLAACA